ncbi:hypothetical protein FOB58_005335 [Candida parapsilosis]|uniref:DUF1992 domain-containing protein n=2 Tax=Candida parapsilosis TaxID=5480 RepID=G8B524_CANPC|nr:uncharacterized protein CPAR2_601360 [Candida parapsilosis]KAF6043620.1 hypothetical protein FOB58_005335 [Candida parapsilosis]KAF6043882.1 hypothetical protein FOB59_004838 [Candida parapsilosis]KAF6045498.1 hypothetical protein FOB60_005070 [Candida parapsilosis]KAF6060284.1 hypothetical protein FOB61_005299 [Candida parapsilosis]KAI5904291.1 hypothetical protein K4G60_g3449 [Candida parapsilosis]
MLKSLHQSTILVSRARAILKRFKATKTHPAKDDDDEVDGSKLESDVDFAIVERMKQILEEKIASSSATPQIRQMNPQINSFLTKYDYGTKDQQQLNHAQSYIKSEPLLKHNKHARDIYNAKPWSGEETNYDANLRMILDSKPKPINDPMATFQLKRKVSAGDKLAMARDGSLDYKINRNPEDKEKAKFREIYKERLLGPSMLLANASSVDFVNSLAGNRINAAIDQQTGRFNSPEMNNVRGKPLTSEHLKNCTDSNYFMNQILNKQEVLPPWIENQQNLNKSIEQFKADLDQLWFKWVINESTMKGYIERATTVDQILDEYEKNIEKITFEDNSLSGTDLAYIQAKIDSLNTDIRHYNLQCPSVSGHKLKLDKDKEVNESYWRTLDKFPTLIEKWFKVHKGGWKSKLVDNPGGGPSKYFNALKLKGSPEIHENKNVDTSLNLWKAIKDVFKMAK